MALSRSLHEPNGSFAGKLYPVFTNRIMPDGCPVEDRRRSDFELARRSTRSGGSGSSRRIRQFCGQAEPVSAVLRTHCRESGRGGRAIDQTPCLRIILGNQQALPWPGRFCSRWGSRLVRGTSREFQMSSHEGAISPGVLRLGDRLLDSGGTPNWSDACRASDV